MSNNLARKIRRTKNTRATKLVKRALASGIPMDALKKAAAAQDRAAAKFRARAATSTYPCDMCGRESTHYRKWRLDDVRRRGLTRAEQEDTTLADTYCRWHAPMGIVMKVRRWVFTARQAINHPVLFTRAFRAYRAQQQLRKLVQSQQVTFTSPRKET